jgi:chorismate dehydratase
MMRIRKNRFPACHFPFFDVKTRFLVVARTATRYNKHMKKRLSVVSYLNSLPLGWGFLHGSQQDVFNLSFSVPSLCADALEKKQADIGLLPAIEYQRQRDLAIIPHLALASKKKVKSVLLISHVPLEKIRSLAADHSSRTSLALLKILFMEKTRRLPELVPHPPSLPQMLDSHDAALIIGDQALKAQTDGLLVYDLAAEWLQLTGHPFVFAFWAVKGELTDMEKAAVQESYRFGISQLDAIAQQQAPILGLSREEILSYLTLNMNYALDEENLAGLECFFDLACRHKIIPSVQPLKFL